MPVQAATAGAPPRHHVGAESARRVVTSVLAAAGAGRL